MAKQLLTSAILLLGLASQIQAQAQALVQVQPQEQDLNVTSPVEDYITQNKRQYAANIISYKNQIAIFRENYQQQVATISQQQILIEDRLTQVDEKLNPLELLSDFTKHCVQKYRYQLPSLAVVKSSMITCANVASNSLNSLMSGPENTMRILDSYYTSNLNTGLNNCKSKNPTSSLNYTLCVTQVINAANVYTISNQKTFANQMKSSKCSGDSQIAQAVDCTFSRLYDAIGAVGATTRLIDDCIGGLEICPPCQNSSQPILDGQCPHSIDLYIKPADFTNSTIQNPFYGLNTTLSCITVNFVQPA